MCACCDKFVCRVIHVVRVNCYAGADLSPSTTGIGYSDDKLLQSRIFSYADTQRHRLGPNYLMLPPNAPKSAHHNNHHEGFMNFLHRDEEVRLFPTRSWCLLQEI